MTRSAVGFNKNQSLLNGLRGTPNYGEAMAAQAQLSLESETENKKSALKQKQDENARENQRNQQKAKTTAQICVVKHSRSLAKLTRARLIQQTMQALLP